MKLVDKIRALFNGSYGEKVKAHERRMTEQEKEYEKDKLYSLINSHPIPAKRLESIEHRDISAD